MVGNMPDVTRGSDAACARVGATMPSSAHKRIYCGLAGDSDCSGERKEVVSMQTRLYGVLASPPGVPAHGWVLSDYCFLG